MWSAAPFSNSKGCRGGSAGARAPEWGGRGQADDDVRVRAGAGVGADPYFSATKIAWILDNVAGAGRWAEAGELAFGTMDSWLLWKLTGGAIHATDATNAARTMLFDIHRQCWDDELCQLFGVPISLLAEVKDCAADFGQTVPEHFGSSIAIAGVAGDQQAAAVGQACFRPGMIKATYGTGCFMMLNTGGAAARSQNGLLTTVAYRLGGRTTYALEGGIFAAGATMQWLRDGLKIIAHASATPGLAQVTPTTGRAYLVPAFTGLGEPHWEPGARGAIVGLTRDSGVGEIVRAALEAVCYQTKDLLGAMTADGAPSPPALRVDGGMVANDWTMQFLADILDIPVERPVISETTALGAAYLAGLATGYFKDMSDIAGRWRCDKRFEPAMAAAKRDALYAGWREAVERVRS